MPLGRSPCALDHSEVTYKRKRLELRFSVVLPNSKQTCDCHTPSSALPFPSLIPHSTALYSHQSVYHALRFMFCFQPPYGTRTKIPQKSDPSPAQRSARMGLILQRQPGKPLSSQLQSQPREASLGPVVKDRWGRGGGMVGLGREEMLAEGG